MKYAKSTYFGGAIIDANECDYSTTSRELGLTCPICDRAVFLKSWYSQKISTHFSHYKIEEDHLILDCENRIKTQAGMLIVAEIELLAKQKRLSIYNKILWQLIFKSSLFDKKDFLLLRKIVGQKKIKFHANDFRKEWERELETLVLGIEKVVRETFEKEINHHPPLLLLTKNKEQVKYFKQKCYLTLHLLICREIAQYLASKNSKGIWVKLTELALILRFSLAETANQPTPEIKNHECLGLIAGIISGTHWIDLIYGEKKKRDAA